MKRCTVLPPVRVFHPATNTTSQTWHDRSSRREIGRQAKTDAQFSSVYLYEYSSEEVNLFARVLVKIHARKLRISLCLPANFTAATPVMPSLACGIRCRMENAYRGENGATLHFVLPRDRDSPPHFA